MKRFLHICNTCLQDEIIPHLGPGQVPSTVDPDAIGASEKGKRPVHRPVRISAWKLAKLDSREAIRAAAEARASSSVLRPKNYRQQPYDTDHLSSSNMSGRSSPVSTDRGYNRDVGVGATRLPPIRRSYPASQSSKDDLETCAHSISNLSSPHHTNNLMPSPMDRQTSNREHFNPIYQSSADQSPWSAKASIGDEVAPCDNIHVPQDPINKTNRSIPGNSRSSVVWDQEAGRFVSTPSTSRTIGTSSQGPELLYTGQSIFFGGPLVNEQLTRGSRNGNSLGQTSLERGGSSNHQSRLERGGQLPVFVPSDSQLNEFSSRLS